MCWAWPDFVGRRKAPRPGDSQEKARGSGKGLVHPRPAVGGSRAGKGRRKPSQGQSLAPTAHGPPPQHVHYSVFVLNSLAQSKPF